MKTKNYLSLDRAYQRYDAVKSQKKTTTIVVHQSDPQLWRRLAEGKVSRKILGFYIIKKYE